MQLPLVAVVAALLATAQTLNAQVLTGTLTDAATGAPIQGAFVQLLDTAGVRQMGVLSDAAGRYRLSVPHPGTYRIRVEQLGFQPATSALIDPAAARRTHDFQLRTQALVLPEVRAEAAGRRCERRPDGAAVYDLWSAIRSALAVTAWATEARALRFTTVNYVRQTDPARRSIRDEQSRVVEGHSTLPYRAVDAAYLAREGYMIDDGREHLLLGIDAEVLLSDEFLDTHCFRLVRGSDTAMIGLGFEPLRRDGRTDVKGVLWVVRDSARLSHVEYEFDNLPAHIRPFGAHGEVRFRRLDDGLWIVDRWVIRTPLVTQRGNRYELTGYREDGGVLQSVSHTGDTQRARPTGAVAGVVLDSVSGGPLAGARVFLSGTGFVTRTDEEGRFRLDGVPAGAYALSFLHPDLSALRLSMPLDSIVVDADVLLQRTLTSASMATILRAVCPGEEEERSEGLVYGAVSDAGAGVEVTASWIGPPPSGSGRSADRWRTAHTDGNGMYAICWVPVDREIMLRTGRESARVNPAGRSIVRIDFD